MVRKNVKERARSMKSLRGKTTPELRVELQELRREQFNLRMAAAPASRRVRTSMARLGRTSRG